MYHIFFIHFSAGGHLGCFCVIAILNSAAINIGVHVSLWIVVFFRYIPRSGIAGSHGSSILFFIVVNKLYSNKKKSLMKKKKEKVKTKFFSFLSKKKPTLLKVSPQPVWSSFFLLARQLVFPSWYFAADHFLHPFSHWYSHSWTSAFSTLHGN